MKKVILRTPEPLSPFGQPARDISIWNKPLWLYQRDLLARHCQISVEVDRLEDAPRDWRDEEVLVVRDNLFFNAPLIDSFIAQARTLAKQTGLPAQIAFARTDKSITTHALPLQEGIRLSGDAYVADLSYYPRGIAHAEEQGHRPHQVIIDTEPFELGYYGIPTYMVARGDLVFYVPIRAFLSIENWVHVFIANVPFGCMAWGRRLEKEVERWPARISIFIRSVLERKHFFQCSAVVKIGRNCSIDPTAIIQGPTIIGDNVNIGAGVVITNSMIGSNVTIMQGAQVQLSVIGSNCYLPFRAGIFMSTLMEKSMLAQNTCVQLCVIGRETFLGAGSTFTDFNLENRPLRTLHRGKLAEVGLPVLGGCVGHSCRIGSGFIIYPCRQIASGTTLAFTPGQQLIRKNVGIDEYADLLPALQQGTNGFHDRRAHESEKQNLP